MSTPNSLVRVRSRASKLRTVVARPRFFPTKYLHHLQTEPYDYNPLRDGLWFKGSLLAQRPSKLGPGHQPPDERTVKLGKSKCLPH